MLRPGLTGRTRKAPFLRLTLDSTSISQFLIHHVEQWLARPESFILLNEKLHGIVQPIRRMVRAVG
jgi:hypothetical protein